MSTIFTEANYDNVRILLVLQQDYPKFPADMHMVESKSEDYVLTFYQMQPSLILFSAFHDSLGFQGQRFQKRHHFSSSQRKPKTFSQYQMTLSQSPSHSTPIPQSKLDLKDLMSQYMQLKIQCLF